MCNSSLKLARLYNERLAPYLLRFKPRQPRRQTAMEPSNIGIHNKMPTSRPIKKRLPLEPPSTTLHLSLFSSVPS